MIFYFILGMFMETLSMMVATVPIIAPIMFKAGYDPVWFGIMIIILMELAMITPPVGINLYVVQGLRKRGKIDDVIIGASPFVITMLLMLLILSIWPHDRAMAAADGCHRAVASDIERVLPLPRREMAGVGVPFGALQLHVGWREIRQQRRASNRRKRVEQVLRQLASPRPYGRAYTC